MTGPGGRRPDSCGNLGGSPFPRPVLRHPKRFRFCSQTDLGYVSTIYFYGRDFLYSITLLALWAGEKYHSAVIKGPQVISQYPKLHL